MERSFPPKKHLNGKDLFHFCLAGRSRDLMVIAIFSTLTVLVSLFLPFANQMLFDYVIPYIDHDLFFKLLIGLALVFLSAIVFSTIKETLVLKVETHLNHDVEVALWQRLLELPVKFFNKFTIGDLVHRIFSITDIRQQLSGQIVRTTLNAIFASLYLVVMFFYSFSLSLVVLGFLFVGLAINAYGFAAIKKRAAQYLNGIINGKVLQIIMGVSKIRTNGAEGRFFRYWTHDAFRKQKLQLEMATIANRVNALDTALEGGKYFAIFLLVMGWIANGHFNVLTLGDYLGFNIALINFSLAFSDLGGIFLELPSILVSANYSKALFKEAPETLPKKIIPPSLQGSIHIDNVSFRYSEDGPWIHQDLSLKIEPGEMVGIVGPSGCGKSSLIRLLLGFESPQKGSIFYDGLDLSTLDISFVRQQTCAILQHSKTMDGTILENITFGQPYSSEAITEAVKMAELDDDLAQFPMGLQTIVAGGGATLSGGQKQRILLSRAFLSTTPILIWDEATANIDGPKQEQIMKNLKKIPATKIVIAHRLTSLRHADRIYMLDKGMILKATVQNNKIDRISNQVRL
jgi:ABC-type bacteriocin/lantibiotic exporter with double-glycine peptidase domain